MAAACAARPTTAELTAAVHVHLAGAERLGRRELIAHPV
jgi:hypothetical protein